MSLDISVHLKNYRHNKGTNISITFKTVLYSFVVLLGIFCSLLFAVRILSLRSILLKFFKVQNPVLLTVGTVFYSISSISLVKNWWSERWSNLPTEYASSLVVSKESHLATLCNPCQEHILLSWSCYFIFDGFNSGDVKCVFL